MSDLDRLGRWLDRKWLSVLLLLFVLYALVQAVTANSNETCAAQCRPYAPEIKVGECYCRTDVVLPEVIPGED